MKILIACDKYKGSLSAVDVCSTIEEAVKNVDQAIETVNSPMADGGEGTVETLVESQKGTYVKTMVKGPLGEEVEACFGIIGQHTAVIEMAQASGMWRVPKEKLNPLNATTFGTGQLIAEALDRGCKKFIVGIGGSATTDGGMGMAQALGVRFYDRRGNALGLGGKQLNKVADIDMQNLHPKAKQAEFDIACDVDNPLTGKRGAAYVFSPQKGADARMVEQLDQGLGNFAKVICGKLDMDVDTMKGAGAAGGLGAGLAAFLGAKLRPGTDIIIEATGLGQKMEGCSLVITGEGAMDKQTFYGKSPYGVAKLAKKQAIPVITINGSLFCNRKDLEAQYADLFCGNFSIINRPMDLGKAMMESKELLWEMTQEIIIFYVRISKEITK